MTDVEHGILVSVSFNELSLKGSLKVLSGCCLLVGLGLQLESVWPSKKLSLDRKDGISDDPVSFEWAIPYGISSSSNVGINTL